MKPIHFFLLMVILAQSPLCFSQTVCITPMTLGRTRERLPNSDTEAFIQQELPITTALSSCSYTQGGLAFNYPANWFSENPNVHISIELATTIPVDNLTYSALITLNSAGQTVINVYKYDTAARCGICTNTACTEAPACSEGTTTFTCNPTGGTCGTCTQISTCPPAGNQICPSTCGTCSGDCIGSGLGCTGNCVGTATSAGNLGTCDGLCQSCALVDCTGQFSGGQCNGYCSACSDDCYGILSAPVAAYQCTGTCSSTTTSCSGICPSTAACTTNAFCPTCSVSCSGVCLECSTTCNGSSICNGNCSGICDSCTTCNGTTQLSGPCNGTCTDCIASCEGECSSPAGPCNGICASCTGCNGECDLCSDTCTGTGTCTGTYIRSCNTANVNEEADTGEVIVHIYALEQPGA